MLARRNAEGALRQAQRILGALYESGERDPETLGIYGRTWIDRYSRSGDRSDLEQSRALYAEAFERAGDDYYRGPRGRWRQRGRRSPRGVKIPS